jgi:hypothetical protein
MGDNWDDEDFELPVISPVSAPSNWDDDEEEIVPEVVVPSSSTLVAAAKKAEEAELILMNKMKYAQLENETPEEKKMRERRQIEEADNDLTGELFGGLEKPKKQLSLGGKSSLGSSAGLASIPLATKTDHSKFGQLVAKRFSDSTAFNVAAFYIALTDKISKKMSTESLDEVLTALNNVREVRKAEEPVKKISLKSTKKELKAKEKKHNDIFGGSSGYDKYDDEYGDMEDNFM